MGSPTAGAAAQRLPLLERKPPTPVKRPGLYDAPTPPPCTPVRRPTPSPPPPNAGTFRADTGGGDQYAAMASTDGFRAVRKELWSDAGSKKDLWSDAASNSDMRAVSNAMPLHSERGSTVSIRAGSLQEGRQDHRGTGLPRGASSTGTNWRRSNHQPVHSTGGGWSLEAENKELREELERHRHDAALSVGNLRRRTMAAIAGGGFKAGPTKKGTDCMCEILRAKLARVSVELREAQRAFALPVRVATCDSEAQTPQLQDPPARPQKAAGVEVEVQASLSAPSRSSACQTAAPAVPQLRPAETQAGSGLAQLCGMSTQTEVEVRQACDASVQALPLVSDCGSQARPSCCEMSVQADEPARRPEQASAEMQAGAPAAFAVTATTQTAAPPRLDAGMQAGGGMQTTGEFSTQTDGDSAPVERKTASVQTAAKTSATVGTETTKLVGKIDRGVQKRDDSALEREAELEAKVQAAVDQSAALAERVRELEQDLHGWKQMAQTKLLGQMCITILCPRAECTVGGDRIDMDSWDPDRLRREFETEVLPRFARVFVEEVKEEGKAYGRPSQADQLMQEFTEVFRERLAAILSAPSAEQAVAAASRPPPSAPQRPRSAARGVPRSGSHATVGSGRAGSKGNAAVAAQR